MVAGKTCDPSLIRTLGLPARFNDKYYAAWKHSGIKHCAHIQFRAATSEKSSVNLWADIPVVNTHLLILNASRVLFTIRQKSFYFVISLLPPASSPALPTPMFFYRCPVLFFFSDCRLMSPVAVFPAFSVDPVMYRDFFSRHIRSNKCRYITVFSSMASAYLRPSVMEPTVLEGWERKVRKAHGLYRTSRPVLM